MTHLDGLSVVLVGPASVVSDARDDTRQVHGLRVQEGLASVESLESGELVDVLLDEVGKLTEEAATLMAGNLQTPGALVRNLGSLDGSVDILSGCSSDLGDDLASRGIENAVDASGEARLCIWRCHVLNGSSVNRVHELAIDEQASVHGGGALEEGVVELVGKNRRHYCSEVSRAGRWG